MLDGIRNHPTVKRAIAAGEAQVGKIATQLLSNEKFVAGIQTIVSSALSAKGALDKQLKRALAAMNLPTTDDVDQLKAKLAELESLLDGLADKVSSIKK